jgi:signal transduction histidine kinase
MSDAILHKLRERVKELTALHRTARILQDHDRPADELMGEIVALLPGAWQFPEIAAARIRFRDRDYVTPGFRDTEWTQQVEFTGCEGEGGGITVAYLEERPPADEGPFLTEERELIDSLGEMLRSHLEHTLADEARREAREALEAQVAARTTDLRRLASRLTLAEERERRRIAEGLHDHIGQGLAFIKFRLREFQGNAIFGGMEGSIDEIMRLLDQTIRYTRDLTGEISPPVLYELGLVPALDWLAEQFAQKHRFRVRFGAHGGTPALPEELTVMLFKSARELLVNSLKYSGEDGAGMILTCDGGTLTLEVRDRGRGFDPAANGSPKGDAFGLFSIRERFRDLGGRVTVESAPGAGCRVIVGVTLPASETS